MYALSKIYFDCLVASRCLRVGISFQPEKVYRIIMVCLMLANRARALNLPPPPDPASDSSDDDDAHPGDPEIGPDGRDGSKLVVTYIYEFRK